MENKGEFSLDKLRLIVKEEILPYHAANIERFRSQESEVTQLRDQVQHVAAQNLDHNNRILRIEGKVDTIIGTPNLEGMLPKLERKLEEEWVRASSFRHGINNTLQSLIEQMAVAKGESSGRREMAGWLKWVLGGIGAAATTILWDAAKHYFWHA